MTPEALALECIRVIRQQPMCPFLVVIGRLKGKGWPRGKVLGSDSRGYFYSYDAIELLGRLVAYGGVKAEKLTLWLDKDTIVKVMKVAKKTGWRPPAPRQVSDRKPRVFRRGEHFFVYVPCNMTLFGKNCNWTWAQAIKFAVGPHICPEGWTQ